MAVFGTIFLPMTEAIVPLLLYSVNSGPCLKPMVQAIYEQLYAAGFREFSFIVGEWPRGMDDHSTSDEELVKELENRDKTVLLAELGRFYKRISDSTIVFINQPAPKGFGDAVLRS